MEPSKPVIWVSTAGRSNDVPWKIKIFHGYKVRYIGDEPDRWTLHRDTVPYLTDAEWYAAPFSGWRRADGE